MNTIVIILIVLAILVGFWFLRQKLETGPAVTSTPSVPSNPQATQASPLNNPGQQVLADKSLQIGKVSETPADAAPYIVNAQNIPLNDTPTVSDAKRDELPVYIDATPVGTSSFSEPVATTYEQARSNMVSSRKVKESVAMLWAKRDLNFFQVTSTARGGEQTTRVAATDIGADPKNTLAFRRVKTPQGDVVVPVSKDDSKILPADLSRLILQGIAPSKPTNIVSSVPPGQAAGITTSTMGSQVAPGQSLGAGNKQAGGSAPISTAPTSTQTVQSTQIDNTDLISKILNQISGLMPKVNQQRLQVVTS